MDVSESHGNFSKIVICREDKKYQFGTRLLTYNMCRKLDVHYKQPYNLLALHAILISIINVTIAT